MRKAKGTGTHAARDNIAEDVLAKQPTKSAIVLFLLTREQGATLAELVDATTWLPHTVRAALTGLRKKGHAIDRRKRGDVTCYHLLASDA